MKKRLFLFSVILAMVISILTPMGIAAVDYSTKTFTSIDLSKTKTFYKYTDSQDQVKVTAKTATETFDLTGSDYVTYQSSDQDIVTVDNTGNLTLVNTGYAIITATITNADTSVVTSKVIINVYRDKQSIRDFETYVVPSPEANLHINVVETPVRTGSKAVSYRQFNPSQTGTIAERWGLLTFNSDSNANKAPQYIGEGWFYDNGGLTNAKAQIRVQSHDKDRDGNVFPMTLGATFGILDDTKNYYMYSNSAASRSNVGPGGTNLTGTSQAGTGYTGDHVVGQTLLDGQNGRALVPRSQGWHQVVVVVDGGTNWDNVGTANGTITAYIDGVALFTDHYVPNTLQAIGGVGYYAYNSSVTSYYDDINMYYYYTNLEAPETSTVSISGTAQSAQLLTANYTYYDENGDAEDTAGTICQWQVSTDGVNFTDVTGATLKTFAPRYADAGKYIRVGVSVKSVYPPYYSEMVYSNPTNQVAPDNSAQAQLYTALDITKTQSVYPENATGKSMIVWGESENGRFNLTQAVDIMYESSNEKVVKVADNGALTILDTGQAVIKVTYANYDNTLVSAQMMLHVYQDGLGQSYFDTAVIPSPAANNHLKVETQNTRTGAQAALYKIASSSGFVHIWGLDHYSGLALVPSQVGEGWFYDNGTNTNAKASIYFQSHDKKDTLGTVLPITMAASIGILNDSQDYYMVNNPAGGRSNVGEGAQNLTGTAQAGTGYTGDKVVSNKVLDGTGGFGCIPRSKGWHQVVCIVDGGTTQANVGTANGTTSVYIDGNLAYQENYVPLNLQVVRGTGQYPNSGEVYSLYDDFSTYNYYPAPKPTEIFVATNGSDTNSGTYGAPFKTVEKARDTVRSLLPSATAPIHVLFREGVYPISATVNFTSADSGTTAAPVTYKAYQNEKVEFIGGRILNSSAITPVTDTSILNRIIDPLARQRLVQLDLASQGITSVPAINDFGFGISTVYRPMEFYFNNSPLTLARWPNNEPNNAYVKTGDVAISQPDPRSGPFSIDYIDPTNRSASWNLTGKTDLFIGGFVALDWAFGAYRVASLNKSTNVITSVNGTPYAPQPNHMIYFFNLLEEIDVPGEYYVDPTALKLYFYPTTDNINQEIKVATLDSYLFNLSGTNNVTFEGLSFGVSRNTAVYANNVDNFVIDNCTFSHLSAYAAYIYGTNCKFKNSYIYDTGAGGLGMGGGNRLTLAPSHNEIYNNRIHSVNRIQRSYTPAIQVFNASGMDIKNNEIYDGPHQLIAFAHSNDITLAYNNIHGAVTESGDMGAVYWGRNLAELGYKIMYNYFHHIGNEYSGGDSGNTGPGQQAVFWDDGASGPYFYGNIIYKGGGNIPGKGYAIKTNGGQYAMVKNNIFVDAANGFNSAQWNGGSNANVPQTKWYYYVQGKDENGTPIPGNEYIYRNYTQTVNYKATAWYNHYQNTMWSWMYNFIEDGPPQNTNKFEGNLAVKIGNLVNGYAVQTDNSSFSDNPGFINYGSDFRLTESGLAQVRQNSPDFENIPTYKIGLRSLVGGNAPVASNLSITNNSGILKANYSFADEDGDDEGFSEVIWYISDTQNGTYQRISGKMGRELLLISAYTGKYIKFTVKPYDQNMRYGEVMTSTAQLIQ